MPVNHWLRTHACGEPYVIATNRQLTVMHPIYRLLHPHLQYTMEINTGMAVEDSNAPQGLRLTIKDYPYASDGLMLCDVLKQWLTEYVNHYYPNPSMVEADQELHALWTEIQTVGHSDKKDEPWWLVLKTPRDLIEILMTIIWVASCHHAAVNFGLYTYAGYFPETRAMVVCDVMSHHHPDEEYIGDKPEPSWEENPVIKAAFEKLHGKLKQGELVKAL
ncbi:Detected protein of unknown function [Hibiscus syriacus]|uniref:Lipoxygenase domain-containing protein n=1 Tax=Hibiscus syriacus TaxID=106335 RepID=A0A6A3B1P9_HIBSY|nr:Detected protein of unknown function [Hibiscus syriacus]